MSKARDIASILSANTSIATDAEVTAAVSTHATAANGHVGRGNTASRPASPTIGDLYFDTTINALIAYRSAGWEKVSQDPAPQIANISPTTAATTGTTITITGANFKSGLSVQFIGTNLQAYNSPIATFVGETTVTATTPALSVANEPYDVKVINSDNQFAILENALDAGGSPTWSTASGTIATIAEQTALSSSVSATDPDGTSIVYSSSNLPAWVTLNSSTGALTGTAPDVASNTTYTFNVTASDGVNTSVRSFSIAVNAIIVPTTLELLVVAGGGGGGQSNSVGSRGAGGGGAGGYRYYSSIAAPSGAFTLTVGDGGGNSTQGQNSVFGSIVATGGGRGGNSDGAGANSGGAGGSGGGAGQHPGTRNGGTGNAGGYSPVEGYAGTAITTDGDPYGGAAGGGAGGTAIYSNPPTSPSNGVSNSITGTSLTYSVGGKGGSGPYASPTPGSANTGSGGEGGSGKQAPYANQPGASGGSGVVVIAYPNTYANIATIPGTLTYTLDTTTRAGYKIYKFTAGSGTVTF
jgi:hypothetical protein